MTAPLPQRRTRAELLEIAAEALRKAGCGGSLAVTESVSERPLLGQSGAERDKRERHQRKRPTSAEFSASAGGQTDHAPNCQQRRCALPLRRGEPKRFDLSRAPRERIAERLGVEDGRCPLPGHTGTAELIERDGELRLRCRCRVSWGWTALGDVRAALATRELRRLRRPGRFAWSLVLAYEVGLVAPADVELPPLPSGAGEDERLVADAFALLLGLRRAVGEREDGAAFSLRFAGALTTLVGAPRALSRRRASAAIGALVEAGVLREAGSAESGYRNATPLYAPGALLPLGAGDVEALPARAEAVQPLAEVPGESLMPDAKVAVGGLGRFAAAVGGAAGGGGGLLTHDQIVSRAGAVGASADIDAGEGRQEGTTA